MRKRLPIKRSKGFTIIEVLAMIVIFGILVILLSVIMARIEYVEDAKGEKVCVEWEDVTVSDCWSYGMGTQCEHYVEKRCVKYEYDDGSGETE